jgi:hypothetical protein
MSNWEKYVKTYPTKLQATTQELDYIPILFEHSFVAHSTGTRTIFASYGGSTVWTQGKPNPWHFLQGNNEVIEAELTSTLPHVEELEYIDIYQGTTQYNGKDIRWNTTLKEWRYYNYRKVHFGSSSTSQEPSEKDPESDSDSNSNDDNDTERVDLILTETTELASRILHNLTSHPSTPRTISAPLPGSFSPPTPETSQVSTPPISKGKQPAPLPPRTLTPRLPKPMQAAGPSTQTQTLPTSSGPPVPP